MPEQEIAKKKASLEDVLQVAVSLHRAGFLQGDALEFIDRFARGKKILYSAETGSGASTLLLSNLSQHHVVFSIEDGNGSVTNVKGSPLLRSETVEFVEGPSQLTLPQHRFEKPLQLVLLDGPHAWPYPDLEYYYFYSHMEEGGLLCIDNVEIPTVRRMFDVLQVDSMWRLDEVVKNTAFFIRTSAPTFPRTWDCWEKQEYNAPYPLSSIDGRPGGSAATAAAEGFVQFVAPEKHTEELAQLKSQLKATEAELQRVYGSATWRWTQGVLKNPLVRGVFGGKIDSVARKSSGK